MAPQVGAGCPAEPCPPATSQAFCTATLIRPNVILTAAHCLVNVDASKLTFALARDTTRPGTDGVAVDRLFTHERYVETESTNIAHTFDIGLAVLKEAVLGVQPAALVVEGDREDLAPGDPVSIVGYGLTDDADPLSGGIKHFAETNLGAIGEFELIVGPPTATAQACKGDSGGPALADFAEGPLVIGVASRTTSEDRRCVGGVIYTRIDPYLDWIEEQLSDLPVEDAGTDLPADAGIQPSRDAGQEDQGPHGAACAVGPRGSPSTPSLTQLIGLVLPAVALTWSRSRTKRRSKRSRAVKAIKAAEPTRR